MFSVELLIHIIFGKKCKGDYQKWDFLPPHAFSTTFYNVNMKINIKLQDDIKFMKIFTSKEFS